MNVNKITTTIGVAALAVAALNLIGGRAEAATYQPYGGCVEAHRYPDSAGAQDCRDHGWLISKRLIVGPRGVVRYSTLGHCAAEDGPGRCLWDGHRDGNGHGLSFWIGRDGRTHYVWTADPTGHGWSWVHQPLADALAEGENTRQAWSRCVVNWGPTTVVVCANGTREVS